MHTPTCSNFKENAREALANVDLQKALGHLKTGFRNKRAAALKGLPEYERLRIAAQNIKDHTLDHLDEYLEAFEEKVKGQGGRVHWARTGDEARELILDICRSVKAGKVIKSKSMITEEIALNPYLEKQGLEVVETDLGEYIIQLRGETPSHIIAPAIHLHKEHVAECFRRAHTELDPERPLGEPRQLLDEARSVLREHFLSADVGITGANFLVAETGSSVLVTNEGNGDLSQTLPKVHIVITSLEKVVPTLNDVSTLLRLLARSATGQEISVYTTFTSGPKREGDPDGPEQYHVILLDNGRSEVLGGASRAMLRCFRCGACMNYCPVYGAIGGHAYGWIYPGPIGSVLTPALIGINRSGHLPNASSFCHKCSEVCPMSIPLPDLLRREREREFDAGLGAPMIRRGLRIWAFLASRPRLYRFVTRMAAWALALVAGRRKRLKRLPLASGWTSVRDLPAPEGKTFQQLWKVHKRGTP